MNKTRLILVALVASVASGCTSYETYQPTPRTVKLTPQLDLSTICENNRRDVVAKMQAANHFAANCRTFQATNPSCDAFAQIVVEMGKLGVVDRRTRCLEAGFYGPLDEIKSEHKIQIRFGEHLKRLAGDLAR